MVAVAMSNYHPQDSAIENLAHSTTILEYKDLPNIAKAAMLNDTITRTLVLSSNGTLTITSLPTIVDLISIEACLEYSTTAEQRRGTFGTYGETTITIYPGTTSQSFKE